MRMTSYQASKMFSDNSLDFVYIDANHSYESVKEDLKVWYPKVTNGGYLFGDDYLGYDREWWYKDQNWTDDRAKDKEIKENGKSLGHFGVNSAVDEFVLDKGIELPLLKSTNRKTAVLNPEGGITNSKREIFGGENGTLRKMNGQKHQRIVVLKRKNYKYLIKLVVIKLEIFEDNMETCIFILDGDTNIHLGMVIQGVLHWYVHLLNKNMVG